MEDWLKCQIIPLVKYRQTHWEKSRVMISSCIFWKSSVMLMTCQDFVEYTNYTNWLFFSVFSCFIRSSSLWWAKKLWWSWKMISGKIVFCDVLRSKSDLFVFFCGIPFNCMDIHICMHVWLKHYKRTLCMRCSEGNSDISV